MEGYGEGVKDREDVYGSGEGRKKIGVKDIRGREGGRDRRRKEKEKGEGWEKGKKEDSYGDREGKKDIYWFFYVYIRIFFVFFC